jgi:hypothetical protein
LPFALLLQAFDTTAALTRNGSTHQLIAAHHGTKNIKARGVSTSYTAFSARVPCSRITEAVLVVLLCYFSDR